MKLLFRILVVLERQQQLTSTEIPVVNAKQSGQFTTTTLEPHHLHSSTAAFCRSVAILYLYEHI